MYSFFCIFVLKMLVLLFDFFLCVCGGCFIFCFSAVLILICFYSVFERLQAWSWFPYRYPNELFF